MDRHVTRKKTVRLTQTDTERSRLPIAQQVYGTNCVTTQQTLCHIIIIYPFDAHCCQMGTAIKHPVPDRVKTAFVIWLPIFDIWALWQSGLSIRVPGCQKLQMMAGLTRSGTGCFIAKARISS